jgi:hypothetical protein
MVALDIQSNDKKKKNKNRNWDYVKNRNISCIKLECIDDVCNGLHLDVESVLEN